MTDHRLRSMVTIDIHIGSPLARKFRLAFDRDKPVVYRASTWLVVRYDLPADHSSIRFYLASPPEPPLDSDGHPT